MSIINSDTTVLFTQGILDGVERVVSNLTTWGSVRSIEKVKAWGRIARALYPFSKCTLYTEGCYAT